MISGTYDGSSMDLYVDGALMTNKAASGSLSNLNTTIAFGGLTKSAYAWPRIWNRALSSSEIRLLYRQVVGAPAVQTFTSLEYPITASELVITNTGFAGTPQMVRWVLVCKTNAPAGANFGVGSELNISEFIGNSGVPVFAGGTTNSTSVWMSSSVGPATGVYTISSGGTLTTIDPVNFKAKCYAIFFP